MNEEESIHYSLFHPSWSSTMNVSLFNETIQNVKLFINSLESDYKIIKTLEEPNIRLIINDILKHVENCIPVIEMLLKIDNNNLEEEEFRKDGEYLVEKWTFYKLLRFLSLFIKEIPMQNCPDNKIWFNRIYNTLLKILMTSKDEILKIDYSWMSQNIWHLRFIRMIINSIGNYFILPLPIHQLLLSEDEQERMFLLFFSLLKSLIEQQDRTFLEMGREKLISSLFRTTGLFIALLAQENLKEENFDKLIFLIHYVFSRDLKCQFQLDSHFKQFIPSKNEDSLMKSIVLLKNMRVSESDLSDKELTDFECRNEHEHFAIPSYTISALHCLKTLIRRFPRFFDDFWHFMLPSTMSQPNEFHLLRFFTHIDSDSKLDTAQALNCLVLDIINTILLSNRSFLRVAQVSPSRKSFVSLAEKLAGIIIKLHLLLFDLLRSGNFGSAYPSLVKCLETLLNHCSYSLIDPSLLKDLLLILSEAIAYTSKDKFKLENVKILHSLLIANKRSIQMKFEGNLIEPLVDRLFLLAKIANDDSLLTIIYCIILISQKMEIKLSQWQALYSYFKEPSYLKIDSHPSSLKCLIEFIRMCLNREDQSLTQMGQCLPILISSSSQNSIKFSVTDESLLFNSIQLLDTFINNWNTWSYDQSQEVYSLLSSVCHSLLSINTSENVLTEIFRILTDRTISTCSCPSTKSYEEMKAERMFAVEVLDIICDLFEVDHDFFYNPLNLKSSLSVNISIRLVKQIMNLFGAYCRTLTIPFIDTTASNMIISDEIILLKQLTKELVLSRGLRYLNLISFVYHNYTSGKVGIYCCRSLASILFIYPFDLVIFKSHIEDNSLNVELSRLVYVLDGICNDILIPLMMVSLKDKDLNKKFCCFNLLWNAALSIYYCFQNPSIPLFLDKRKEKKNSTLWTLPLVDLLINMVQSSTHYKVKINCIKALESMIGVLFQCGDMERGNARCQRIISAIELTETALSHPNLKMDVNFSRYEETLFKELHRLRNIIIEL